MSEGGRHHGRWGHRPERFPFTLPEPQREADIGLLQNLFFHALHEESDHIPSRDSIESVEITEIFSLDDRWYICVFTVSAKTPDILIFRAFDKSPFIFPRFYLRNFTAVDGASITSLVPDVKFSNLFLVEGRVALEDSRLKVSYRMGSILIHTGEDGIRPIFLE